MNRILVIDDDLEILNVMQIVLNMKGYEVKALSDWKQIDNAIENYRPHLIIMDINLGGADGRYICQGLKNKFDTQYIPIILFSANMVRAEQLVQFGADDFISKPFDNNFLIQTVNKHLLLSELVY